VVEHLKHMPRSCANKRVVKRRAEVNENERCAEDAATHDDGNGSARGCGYEEDCAHNGEKEADAVGDGVGEDVSQMEMRLHIAMIDVEAGELQCSRRHCIAAKSISRAG